MQVGRHTIDRGLVRVDASYIVRRLIDELNRSLLHDKFRCWFAGFSHGFSIDPSLGVKAYDPGRIADRTGNQAVGREFLEGFYRTGVAHEEMHVAVPGIHALNTVFAPLHMAIESRYGSVNYGLLKEISNVVSDVLLELHLMKHHSELMGGFPEHKLIRVAMEDPEHYRRFLEDDNYRVEIESRSPSTALFTTHVLYAVSRDRGVIRRISERGIGALSQSPFMKLYRGLARLYGGLDCGAWLEVVSSPSMLSSYISRYRDMDREFSRAIDLAMRGEVDNLIKVVRDVSSGVGHEFKDADFLSGFYVLTVAFYSVERESHNNDRFRNITSCEASVDVDPLMVSFMARVLLSYSPHHKGSGGGGYDYSNYYRSLLLPPEAIDRVIDRLSPILPPVSSTGSVSSEHGRRIRTSYLINPSGVLDVGSLAVARDPSEVAVFAQIPTVGSRRSSSYGGVSRLTVVIDESLSTVELSDVFFSVLGMQVPIYDVERIIALASLRSLPSRDATVDIVRFSDSVEKSTMRRDEAFRYLRNLDYSPMMGRTRIDQGVSAGIELASSGGGGLDRYLIILTDLEIDESASETIYRMIRSRSVIPTAVIAVGVERIPEPLSRLNMEPRSCAVAVSSMKDIHALRDALRRIASAFNTV